MPSPTDEALVELNARLAERGIRARVYVHDGMTAVMIHRGGDAAATIDEAFEDGPEVVEELAAQIAKERSLPADWLSRFGIEPPAVSTQSRLTIRERSLRLVLQSAARLAERCVAAARQPDASRFKKRCALAGIRMCQVVVKLARRFLAVRD